MPHEALKPEFLSLIDADAPLRVAGSGFQFTEGPIWHPKQGFLLFSYMPGDTRRRFDAKGVAEQAKPPNKGDGMTYDKDLNLQGCEHPPSRVARFVGGAEGKREVLASHSEGKELNSPNDI